MLATFWVSLLCKEFGKTMMAGFEPETIAVPESTYYVVSLINRKKLQKMCF